MMTHKLTRVLASILLLGASGLVLYAQDPTGRDLPAPAAKATVKKPAPQPASKRTTAKPSATKSKPAARSAKTQPKSKPATLKSKPATSKSATAKSTSRPAVTSAKPAAQRSPTPAVAKNPVAQPTKPPTPAAKLTIAAPPGALVELNGRARGFTGVDGTLVLAGLDPGDHQLVVSLDGYETWRGTFVMSAAATRFEVPLKRRARTGQLAIRANEPDTEVIIDGQRKIKTPPGQAVLVEGLAAGKHRMYASKPGFQNVEADVIVNASETMSVVIEMKPMLNPEMLRVIEGVFLQGNDRGDRDQRPAHEVYLPAFEIAGREVTNRLYKIFIDASGHAPPTGSGFGWNGKNYAAGQDDMPVVFITWDDANAFCVWLSKQTGMRYRLPTEAEWEKAARLVSQKYTSAGMVWEWCADWYAPDYYKRRERKNPQGPTTGKEVKLLGREAPARVLRGGPFGKNAVKPRAAERSYQFPEQRRSDIGFRIVREGEPIRAAAQ